MNVRPESTPADGSQPRWSRSTIALHWLSAALILVLLGLGWFMVHGDIKASTKFDLYQLHKSLGFLSLALLLLRLGARLARPSPAAPPAMPFWERRLAAPWPMSRSMCCCSSRFCRAGCWFPPRSSPSRRASSTCSSFPILSVPMRRYRPA